VPKTEAPAMLDGILNQCDCEYHEHGNEPQKQDRDGIAHVVIGFDNATVAGC
jgi:hypothetical protein